MKTRVRCPWHQEKTPSLVRRKSDWFCYGACHKAYSLEEVRSKAGVDYEYIEDNEEKEDLDVSVSYIKSLRRSQVRGLSLPVDERGYYVLWPDHRYYKYRVFDPKSGSKYIGPKGHSPPLFWAREEGNSTLYLVEGEINALSISEVLNGVDVCSPGSASCFNSSYLNKYLTTFKKYAKVVVVLDKDAAGIKGLIESKAFFLYKLPFVDFILLSPDANELLIENKETLRERLQRSYPK